MELKIFSRKFQFFFFSNVSIKRNGAIRNRTYQLKEDKISIFLIKFSLRVKI